jgi:hypothetical protein
MWHASDEINILQKPVHKILKVEVNKHALKIQLVQELPCQIWFSVQQVGSTITQFHEFIQEPACSNEAIFPHEWKREKPQEVLQHERLPQIKFLVCPPKIMHYWSSHF